MRRRQTHNPTTATPMTRLQIEARSAGLTFSRRELHRLCRDLYGSRRDSDRIEAADCLRRAAEARRGATHTDARGAYVDWAALDCDHEWEVERAAHLRRNYVQRLP